MHIEEMGGIFCNQRALNGNIKRNFKNKKLKDDEKRRLMERGRDVW